MKTTLPVVNDRVGASSLRTDGTRARIVPADVRGRFQRGRRVAGLLLVAFWAGLPWIRIGGEPALFLDIERRRFFVFGASFNAQDLWLLFFFLTGAVFSLVFVTAVVGRVWCGWACPQTVFLENVFRPIERLVNGSREQRQRRARHPESEAMAVFRQLATQVLFALASVFVAHVFVAYFVSLPSLFAMMRRAPGEHLEAFVWMVAISALFYANFAWFREQLCVVVCPYGRLQSIFLDDNSLIVGYDEQRGEPRGKKSSKATGDCVDCGRCVAVCPTGIDIRNGLQMDCIACTQCIDACDDVMGRLGRASGLVRYDSLRGLRKEARRILRPRVLFYGAMLVVGAVVATFALRSRASFEANLIRLPGAPFTKEGESVRNGFQIHLVSKSKTPETFDVEGAALPGAELTIPMRRIEIEPLGSRVVPFFVTGGAMLRGQPKIRLVVRRENGESRELEAVFLGGRP